MPTRDEIVERLEKEDRRLREHFGSLSAEDVSRPCTASEVDGAQSWCAKDHIAHLAMIERAFQQMIRRTLEGAERPINFTGTTREEVIAGVHRGNQENVDAHRDDDLDTLLADLAAARADSLKLLDELSDEDLARKVPGAPWADGTIGGVLITNAYHQRQHWDWIEEGLANTPASG